MGSSYRSKMSSKGQIVIPSEVRKRLGLRPGTQVIIAEDNGRLIIEQRRQIFQEIFQLSGILKEQDESLAKLIQEHRQLERDHFERLERLAPRNNEGLRARRQCDPRVFEKRSTRCEDRESISRGSGRKSQTGNLGNQLVRM